LATLVSLAPGFSPVLAGGGSRSRFNGLFARLKAAEAAALVWPSQGTGLKPGVNEKQSEQTILKRRPRQNT
jgi:hypothetical protein